MKQISLSIALFISIVSCLSQNEKETFPFDEFSVSCNRTTIGKDQYTQDRFGYGAGLYITGFKKYMVNFITGIDFNRTHQFHARDPYLGHFNFARDVIYHITSFSIPLNMRVNFGRKRTFFIETGISPELTGGKTTGTLRIETYQTDSLGHTIITSREEKLDYKSAGLTFFNLGLSGGAGIAIPLNKKFDLILKSDYHFGLRNLDPDNTIFNRYFRIVVGLKINYFKEEQKTE